MRLHPGGNFICGGPQRVDLLPRLKEGNAVAITVEMTAAAIQDSMSDISVPPKGGRKRVHSSYPFPGDHRNKNILQRGCNFPNAGHAELQLFSDTRICRSASSVSFTVRCSLFPCIATS